jgi:hypothetical protein
MFWAASVAAVGLCWVGWLIVQRMPVSVLIWPALDCRDDVSEDERGEEYGHGGVKDPHRG